ncbi:hypothetical protein O181_029638 [Austropuccinia psidii MF-1]|uniref:Uncharacterized protein n=1 Tax=Austropuccinia psidii MF-1 TaxID=1389203 RepID=A0A9Q3H2X7_9BASI|nr:hypothetical protein [Austropuccinia psidii MF-1]
MIVGCLGPMTFIWHSITLLKELPVSLTSSSCNKNSSTPLELSLGLGSRMADQISSTASASATTLGRDSSTTSTGFWGRASSTFPRSSISSLLAISKVSPDEEG